MSNTVEDASTTRAPRNVKSGKKNRLSTGNVMHQGKEIEVTSKEDGAFSNATRQQRQRLSQVTGIYEREKASTNYENC
jgi:hypothetical protein